MSRKYWILGLALIILCATVTTVFADEGIVVRAGDVIDDDIATRDSLLIEEGGVVAGDVNLLSGDATISGTVQGDVFIVGGNVVIADSAEIRGDCFIVGGNIRSAAESTQHTCSVVGEGANIDVAQFTGALPQAFVNVEFDGSGAVSAETTASPTTHTSPDSPLWGAVVNSILLAALAFFVALVAPTHIDRIGDAITAKPVASGTVGVLTFISTVSLGAILAAISALLIVVFIGLLGLPLVVALAGLLVAGIGVGWAAVGTLFGELIADKLRLGWTSMPLTAGVGTLLLSLAIGFVGWFSWGGFATVIGILVSMIGLGATALTKFGSLSYPRVIVDPVKESLAVDNMTD